MDAQKSFYSKLYQRQETNRNSAETKRFLDNPSIAKLSEEQRTSCEGKITIEECDKTLGSFRTGKTPGNDGIPIEFYKTFWPLIGEFIVNLFNEAYDNREMSSSQRKAIITLIEKEEKDRNYLENWRLMSLTNVDAKIASKVIAARIIPVLRDIITSTQTGYVKGRFIGEAVRSIIDVMDYTKEQNIPSILLFINFEKAFDSLDWNFMLKCLNVFGFGPSLSRWIETFYTNISSCVLNNGLCSQYFEVQRGVRQGDPSSPYLFTIVAEILAIAIQTNTDIQGLKIGKEKFKLVQYADDLTVFVPNIACAQLVFSFARSVSILFWFKSKLH